MYNILQIFLKEFNRYCQSKHKHLNINIDIVNINRININFRVLLRDFGKITFSKN